MSIWNKVLIGLIAVASVAFFYLSMRVLKTHDYWRKAYFAHEKAIQAAAEETQRLIYGDKDGKSGIVYFKNKLHALRLLDQGGQMWTNCTARVADPQAAKVTLVFDAPPGPAAPAKATLYAFDAAPVKDGGRFLGEFRVTEVADKQLVLQPMRQLSKREIDRIAQTKGAWTVCTMLPLDSREVFADKTEEELKSLFPAESLPDYLHDGKPAAPTDPPARVVGGKFVRPLRNYGRLLEDAFADRTVMIDALQSLAQDKLYLDAALAEAGQADEKLHADVATAKQEKEQFSRQRQAVMAHLTSVAQKVRDLQAYVSQQIVANQRSAAELAKCQIQATQHIDRRTSAMAQTEASR
jgi:hypothetical protein